MDFNKLNISSYLPTMPYAVRELFDKATNIIMNYTETEAKVVEATNDESWGPAGKLLQDLSQLTFSSEHYNELMSMLWKRCFIQDKRYWRRTYKCLLVLTYLIKNGSEKVVRSVREHIYDLKNLESFSYHDENGKDQGINIRHKTKELLEFLQDENRVRDERKKAKANRDKYIGMSNESSFPSHNRFDGKDESTSRNFDGHWKSKTVEDFSKVKDFESDDFSSDKSFSNNINQNLKSTKFNEQTKVKNPKTSASIDNFSSTNPNFLLATSQTPDINLLGDDIDFTPYVQTSQDDEFGQFQEAPPATSSVQTILMPISTESSSSTIFDPFESTVTTSQPPLFLSNQPQQQLFTTPSVLSSQQSFTQPSLFAQTSSIQSKPNNTWSSMEGKLDISLNNLIPHTRGNQQKNSLTLNQLTNSTNTGFTTFNTNTQSIFSSKK